jgi:hypothetical protein
MLDYNVIICGIIKNGERVIEKNIDLAIKTGELFNKYKLVVYENNSTDNTKLVLNKFNDNSNIKIISEDLQDINLKKNNKIWAYTEITGSDHPCRIEHISNARNKLLNEIRKNDYIDFQYVIMIDFDSQGWSLSGITDSFDKVNKWDAIFGYSQPYYDFYALKTKSFIFGPEILGCEYWKLLNTINNNNSELIPVFSAFNGIGIYKKIMLDNYSYNFEVDNSVKKFYRQFIKNNNIDSTILKKINSPCETSPYFENDEETQIVWKSNSGYDKPVVCEHICLNLQLCLNNFRLFINPKMLYYR